MSEHSAIGWTDATWNPTTGCTKISPACAHCYIERTPPFRIAGSRFDRQGHIPLQLHRDRLDTPKHWRQPKRIFVNSLSDLFHPDVPTAFISAVYDTMEQTPHHTYQVLTKRAERQRDFVRQRYQWIDPPAHIWHGISAENQRMLAERGDSLRQTRSAVRFISAEPLLSALCLDVYLPLVSWVIVGGESGPRVRPTDPAWVRSIRDQCLKARVAFFFKQWGGRTPLSGGRDLDGRTWSEFPRYSR